MSQRDPKELHVEFTELAKPLIKWLNENYHPHAVVMISTDSAAVMEGSMAFSTEEYVRD